MGDRIVSVLTLEYETLRAEILGRSSSRFQLLSVATAGAALLVAASTPKAGDPVFWVGVALAAALLVLGFGTFWRMGLLIGDLSKQLASLEVRINKALQEPYGLSEPLLTWESDHQGRKGLKRLGLGQGGSDLDEGSQPVGG